ncbi:aminotransferase class I/II-fold pyridoxal phosphate-dependent enzyme [Sporosarcina soli]|uniref:Aminotransferase class I/II-fold pyridoxal phosphate-dependent enzyme n=1 Tax=Sporosarcina soli TaxID=334736 RepID=A0ABW0TR16_9BACL
MEYKERPLIRKLLEFERANPVSFHVPGHKHGRLSGLPMELRDALRYDFTELEGLDDLHEPAGVIAEAQQLLASTYSSDCSFFLVNGSTVGNLAMVYATCRAGDTIIVQRNAHKSVFHAIELTGAKPVYVSPNWDDSTKSAGVLTADTMKRAIEAYPYAKAVILTYPTYYGTTGSELKDTIKICHSYGIPVLVDEAHGAHFVAGEPFPKSALELGADVVVHSAHKTLPAMTMASFLHIKSTLVSSQLIAHYLQMLQSSSPSYILMASLDDARSYIASYTEEDKAIFMIKRLSFIKRLKSNPRLQTVESDDPLKLLLRMEGYSGFELQRCLEKQGVYSELADPYQVLFVLPLLKSETDYPFEETCRRIQWAIAELEVQHNANVAAEVPVFNEEISSPVYSFAKIAEMESEWIPFEQSAGRVVAGSIIPYPPGIPFLISGERVSEEDVCYLDELQRMGAKFQGAIRVHEKQMLVVKKGMEE